MRIIIPLLLLFLLANSALQTQNLDEPNVLSYYSVNNTLDGQPLVDRTNILRFYPPFVYRDHIEQVRVTVYHGSHIYSRCAVHNGDGIDCCPSDRFYWTVTLPQFTLGEAIQRIDVEVVVGIKQLFLKELNRLRESTLNLHDLQQGVERSFQQMRGVVNEMEMVVAERLRRGFLSIPVQSTSLYTVDKSIIKMLTSLREDAVNIETEVQQALAPIKQLLESKSLPDINMNSALNNPWQETQSLQGMVSLNIRVRDLMSQVEKLQQGLEDQARRSSQVVLILDALHKDVQAVHDEISSLIIKSQQTGGLLTALTHAILVSDTIHNQIASSIHERIRTELRDSTFSGNSVRPSDIILELDSQRVRILYRNYKPTLRRLPALDPAERIGIFRARYIPFIVLGRRLVTPFNSPTARDSTAKIASAVFEIGLAFGDQIVSGDDFVVPEFSLRRLGVAFAISEHLFNDDAQIRALALTYDFNSYGSIAVGANFPATGGIQSYLSFGINKKAFEDLLRSLQGLF